MFAYRRICSDSIFLQARADFMSSLRPQEQTIFSACNSSKEVLQEFESLEIVKNNTHRLKSQKSKLKSLLDALEPYLEVVTILVSAYPNPAAFVWGALKLALRVCWAPLYLPTPLQSVSVAFIGLHAILDSKILDSYM